MYRRLYNRGSRGRGPYLVDLALEKGVGVGALLVEPVEVVVPRGDAR